MVQILLSPESLWGNHRNLLIYPGRLLQMTALPFRVCRSPRAKISSGSKKLLASPAMVLASYLQMLCFLTLTPCQSISPSRTHLGCHLRLKCISISFLPYLETSCNGVVIVLLIALCLILKLICSLCKLLGFKIKAS